MVTVKLFGPLRLDTGVRELQVEARRVRELYAPLEAELRRLAPGAGIGAAQLKSCRVSVDGRFAVPGTPLKDGDTVYLFPAAAGG